MLLTEVMLVVLWWCAQDKSNLERQLKQLNSKSTLLEKNLEKKDAQVNRPHTCWQQPQVFHVGWWDWERTSVVLSALHAAGLQLGVRKGSHHRLTPALCSHVC